MICLTVGPNVRNHMIDGTQWNSRAAGNRQARESWRSDLLPVAIIMFFALQVGSGLLYKWGAEHPQSGWVGFVQIGRAHV